MKKYKVWVRLETEYDDIMAEDEEEAFVKASNFAMDGALWERKVELVEDEEEAEVEE